MRSTIFTYFAVAVFFSSCAYQGTIVEKRFRPAPFYSSMGIDGIYNFQLRDSAGQIHSQMVTPEVFASYEVGDYFNDLQPPPTRDSKDAAPAPAPVEMNQLPYQPVKTTRVKDGTNGVAKSAQHPVKRATKTAAKTINRTARIANTVKTKGPGKKLTKVANGKRAATRGSANTKAKDLANRKNQTAKIQRPKKSVNSNVSAKPAAKKTRTTAKLKSQATRSSRTAKVRQQTRPKVEAVAAHHRSTRTAKTTETKVRTAVKPTRKGSIRYAKRAHVKRSSKTAKAQPKAKQRKITRKQRTTNQRASA